MCLICHTVEKMYKFLHSELSPVQKVHTCCTFVKIIYAYNYRLPSQPAGNVRYPQNIKDKEQKGRTILMTKWMTVFPLH